MRGPAALLARSTLESLASFCYRTGITKPCVTTARLHFSRLQHQTPVHTLSVLAYDSTCYHRPGATPTFSSLFSCQSIEPFSKQFHRQFSEKPSDEKKLSVFQRFKTVYKEHGKTLLAVHFVTSIVWYGGFYLAARSGVDLLPLIIKLGASEVVQAKFTAAGDFLVAYILYEIFKPVRYLFTLAATRQTVLFLRSRGTIPPLKPEDKLRNLAKEGGGNIKDKYQERRQDLKGKYADKRAEYSERWKRVKHSVKKSPLKPASRYRQKNGKGH